MASRRYTAEEVPRILFELPNNGDISDNEDELENDALWLLIKPDNELDNELKDSDSQMRTTTYQLHWQGEGVVVLDLGMFVVEREQGKQQQMWP